MDRGVRKAIGVHQRSTFLSKNRRGPRCRSSEELNGPGVVPVTEWINM